MNSQPPGAMIDTGACSHVGRVRAVNEDAFTPAAGAPSLGEALVQSKGRLFVVADGMGGHEAGEVASAMAVAAIHDSYYAAPEQDLAQCLERAIDAANLAIHAESLRRFAGERLMGTTVVCAVVHRQTLLIAHVGDSRAYHFRGDRLLWRTIDHDWVSELAQTHAISHADALQIARKQGSRGRLLRAVGVEPTTLPDVVQREWRAGDVLVLCSDGLHAMVSDDQIAASVLAARPQPAAQRTAEELVSLANHAGGHDNITVVVAASTLPAAQRRQIAGRRAAQSAAPMTRWAGRLPTLLALAAILAIIAAIIIGVAATPDDRSAPEPLRATAAPANTAPPTAAPTTTLLPTAPLLPAILASPQAPVTPEAVPTIEPQPTQTLRPTRVPAQVRPTGIVASPVPTEAVTALPPAEEPTGVDAPAQVTMPALRGLPRVSAVEVLGQLPFNVTIAFNIQCQDKLGEEFLQFAPDTVVSTDPPPDTVLLPDQAVALGIRAPDAAEECQPAPQAP